MKDNSVDPWKTVINPEGGLVPPADETGGTPAESTAGFATRPGITSDSSAAGQGPEWEFTAPGYQILAELGRGGMGVVYRARHLPSGEVVALKTLQRLTPAALYRFKHEFRVAAGLAHPNLVTLRELVADGAQWFFTMELLDGIDLRRHVQGGDVPPTMAGDAVRFSSAEETRLRAVLDQLVSGAHALHTAGILHRDIKPGNILVTTTGRVVLLDFGLAGELPADGLYHSSPGQVCGTIAYMAPEQAAGEALSPAADWYAVGVVLYELLAGRLPFEGSSTDILIGKQRRDPPPPSQFRAEVPADLERLCMELLQRDPARRPGGSDIHRRLRGIGSPAESVRGEQRTLETRLVGRDDHVRMLREAFAAVRQGEAVCARICGPSGSGKSTLARSVLERLSDEGAVTLSGRCYEQEQVPYKAFDGVIDTLSQHLAWLPHNEAAALLPRDVGALTRLFPVLGRVPAVAAAPPVRGETPGPREVRRRGLGALRELLARLGDRSPLVVFVDDLQWGDADSAVLLEELLRPPDPPALMVILCYRSEEAADNPSLQVVGRIAPTPPALQVVDLRVDALSPHDAQELARHILSREGEAAGELAELIARQAGGNPFYVGELAEAARAGLPIAGAESLDRLLWERSRGLSPEARRLLEAVVVAGRPIRLDVARRAAGVEADFHAAQAALRVGRLLRGTGMAGEDHIAPYHDRVREAVLAYLSPDDRRGYHRELARAAEATSDHDPEFLAIHFHGAGEHETAARHYAAAGSAASAATAFDQAARLFHLAAELGSHTAADEARLRAAEADALANAGRGATAAEAYLAAAALAGGDEAVEWRRRAAEQFLITGHLDVGLRTLQEVVASVGLPFPPTTLRAILGLLWGRLRLRLRGIGFRSRPAAVVPSRDLRRIDVCWSATTGLSLTDYVRGAYFQTKGLLLALAAGEPGRVARALALQGAHTSARGPAADAKSLRLIEAGAAAAADPRDPYPQAVVTLARGIRDYCAGRYPAAVLSLAAAEQVFRASCTGVTWELDTARTFRLWCLGHMGEVRELATEWPPLLRDARDRGDLYAVVNLGTYIMANLRTAADEAPEAREVLQEVGAQWSQQGFHLQHHNMLMATVTLHLYQGNGAAAWEQIRDKEPLYRRATFWHVQQTRIDVRQLRARSALAAATQAADPRPLLRCAARDAQALERECAAWGQALGLLVRACVHDATATTRTPNLFAAAATRLEAVHLGMFAAAARYRQGERAGGDDGQRLRDEALAWLTAQDVRNPHRIIQSHAPVPEPTG